MNEAPEHLHLLPSILSPLTSYPLVGMHRSNRRHHLPNWATKIAIQRKLRLPVYNTNNAPVCRCGTQHDCWGDHTFKCKRISKMATHHIIRDSWAQALQPALSTAGYIRQSTPIDVENPHIHTCDTGARPFDVSFNPDHTILNDSQTHNVHSPPLEPTLLSPIVLTLPLSISQILLFPL